MHRCLVALIALALAELPATAQSECVACLVDPSLPCCPRPAPSTLPSRPGDDEILRAVAVVRPMITACRRATVGMFKVRMVVSAAGGVMAVSIAGALIGSEERCVVVAARAAHFPASQRGVTLRVQITW